MGPTLQGLAEQTNVDLDQISILFALKSFGFLMGSFVIGRLYDRISGHPIMVTAMLGMVAMLILVPLAGQLPLLGGAILLLGLAMGSLDIGGNTLLVWTHREKVGPYMNGLHFIWGVGGVLTPLILVGLTYIVTENLRWTYWSMALFLIPIAVWMTRIPSPIPVAEQEEETDDSNQVLLLGLIALFYFLYIGAEATTSGWLVTYASKTGLASETSAAFLNSLFFATLTITRLIMIPLAARYRPSQILMADLAICIASALLLVLQPLSWTMMLIGVGGLGIGMSSIFPMMLAFAQNRMPVTGKTTSWFFLGGGIGGMSVPWIVGQLFERVSPQVVLMTILICVLGTAVVFWLIKTGWERRPRS